MNIRHDAIGLAFEGPRWRHKSDMHTQLIPKNSGLGPEGANAFWSTLSAMTAGYLVPEADDECRTG
jgi:hypothetical protein